MQCIWSGSRAMRHRQRGASTASSRVWHRRHPATVEFGSIHKTATFVRSYMSKDSVAIDNMEDGII